MIGKIKSFIDALSSFHRFNKLDPSWRKIIFYAEDSQSKNFLIDLVEELTKNQKQKVCYLTSDPEDTIFDIAKNNKKINVFFIGTGIIRTLAFMNLKADLCIMTMPDLDKYHLKKSIAYPVHYLYIFHALLSTHSIYRNGAFDAYDTIFCTGEHQINEIRKTEKLYNLPRKNLFKDGYRPLEFLINENISYSKPQNDKKKILIAPTWGKNNILNHCINLLLEDLLKADFEVYLRPHPMSLRHEHIQINEVKSKFRDYSNFIFQDNLVCRNILFDSDILITDWSGIGVEYGIGLLKPVLYIDLPKKNLNPESKKLNIEPIETAIRTKIGTVINPENLDGVSKTILQMIADNSEHDLTSVRHKYVFMKENGLTKSAKRVISIAEACAARNEKSQN